MLTISSIPVLMKILLVHVYETEEVWSKWKQMEIFSVSLLMYMSRDMSKPTKWLCIRPVWSESSLCAQWVAKDPSFLHADSKDSDQTGRIPRLIWVFVRRTLTLLVLSCCSSHVEKALNSQYTSQFTREPDGHLPDIDSHPVSSMPDIDFTLPGIQKLLNNLNPTKASGPDLVPALAFKEIAPILCVWHIHVPIVLQHPPSSTRLEASQRHSCLQNLKRLQDQPGELQTSLTLNTCNVCK